MPQPVHLSGAADLGRPTTIQVKDIRVFAAASMTFQKGGCDRPGCELRAEVVDIPNATVYLIPSTVQGARLMHEQLGAILAELDGAGRAAE